MNKTIPHNFMYAKAITGLAKSIDILNSDLNDNDKVTLCLRTLISISQQCEDIYIAAHEN